MSKTVELLAPVGNWDVLVAVIDAGADAVYMGGKGFSMRMHRKDMLLSDDELRRAVEYAHAHNVRLYVTVNNLVGEDELPALEQYLRRLAEIGPDALITQDFAVIDIIASLNLPLTVHGSVMMNVHSADGANFLRERNVPRVVTSREMPLAELARWRRDTDIELEYFVHGDMCIAESGQCYHSAITFGMPGNRGRCLKPCRWQYRLYDETAGMMADDRPLNRLSINDMNMYAEIPAMIEAGVVSFKVEGRMRPAPFLRRLIGTYRRAIDRYLADPGHYTVDAGEEQSLEDNKVRDYTTEFALHRPTVADITLDPKREPKIFSVAKPEPSAPQLGIRNEELGIKRGSLSLAVRVSSLECARAAIDNGADIVYVGGEVYKPLTPWTVEELQAAIDYAHEHNAKTVLMTPRTTMSTDDDRWKYDANSLNFDGLMVGNLGALYWAKIHCALPLTLDFGFNLTNSRAVANVCKGANVEAVTPAIDMTAHELLALAAHSPVKVSPIVHGSLEAMISDFAARDLCGGADVDDSHRYALVDTVGGHHSLRVGQYGRTHILFAKDLCLYGQLGVRSKELGVAAWRIEAQDYDANLVAEVTALYRRLLDGNGVDGNGLERLESHSPRPFGSGAFGHESLSRTLT